MIVKKSIGLDVMSVDMRLWFWFYIFCGWKNLCVECWVLVISCWLDWGVFCWVVWSGLVLFCVLLEIFCCGWWFVKGVWVGLVWFLMCFRIYVVEWEVVEWFILGGDCVGMLWFYEVFESEFGGVGWVIVMFGWLVWWVLCEIWCLSVMFGGKVGEDVYGFEWFSFYFGNVLGWRYWVDGGVESCVCCLYWSFYIICYIW